VCDSEGRIWLSGRYRNYGDSRTGLTEGTRGFACAIFCSEDGGQEFQEIRRWTKGDLSVLEEVVSIEGTALLPLSDGSWEFYISMEKAVSYPEPYASYQKPGTGVWQIDRICGESPQDLQAESLTPTLVNHEWPEYLHIKDPYIISGDNGETRLGFCSHPISWASSNSGVAVRPAIGDPFQVTHWEMVSRGSVWDVAATRITGQLQVPAVGHFASTPPISLYFYDGAECLRQHDENPNAYTRPRGYSCEELGGMLYGWNDNFPRMERLSRTQPLFISPWGSGSSRYVDVLTVEEGIFAFWQQSQKDGSQPLVTHFLPIEEVERILSA
jgi:hypothetical protein